MTSRTILECYGRPLANYIWKMLLDELQKVKKIRPYEFPYLVSISVFTLTNCKKNTLTSSGIPMVRRRRENTHEEEFQSS